MSDLANLGSATEIAAAAMAAAGLDGVLERFERSDAVDGEAKSETVAEKLEELEGQSSIPLSVGIIERTDADLRKRSHDKIEDHDSSSDNDQGQEPASKRSWTEGIRTSNSNDVADSLEHQSPSSAKVEPILGDVLLEGGALPERLQTDSSSASRDAKAAGFRDNSVKEEHCEGTNMKPPKPNAAQTTSASAALALLSGIQNLEAVAQAAMGLDAQGNPLPGNEESHRALAEAVKRLNGVQTYSSGGFTRTIGAYQAESNNADADGSPLKRFQCHLCERAFARAYNLNTHLATHDPDPAKSKPFPCPYPSCKADGGRSFSRKHDLQRHVASTHENEPVPEDEEDVDENGSRVSVLTKLGLGTPGRKFRCDDCGRAFVRRDALKRHQCVPSTHTPPSSTGSPQPTSSVKATKQSPSVSHDVKPHVSQTVGMSNSSMPLGLSLYTSTAPAPSNNAQTQKSQGGQGTNANPLLPGSLSYESLSREVQDMAMHLVAQATSYNQAHGSTKSTDLTISGEKKEQKQE